MVQDGIGDVLVGPLCIQGQADVDLFGDGARPAAPTLSMTPTPS
ncbi:hypothetical protein [Rhodobacter sp. NTK016B]